MFRIRLKPRVNAAVQSVLAASGNTSCSVIMSNVRGPPRALHINGLNLSRLYGFLPAPAGVALGVGIGTYAGTVALSVACDKARLGEGAADEILRLMMEGHNKPMQDMMRDQEENKKSFNLLTDVVNLATTIAKDTTVLRGLPKPI